MSRWINNFQNHAFQIAWAQLKTNLEQSKIDDITVDTSVSELGRLKKVITYLDELINGIDVELVPIATWDQFNNQVGPCNQNIVNYNSNRNISHITNANSHADNLLTYIRPYMVIKGNAARAMQQSLISYSKTIRSVNEQYRKDTLEMVKEIEKYKDEGKSLFDDIEVSNNKIKQFELKLFSSETDEEKPGTKEQIETLVEDFEEKYNKISMYYNETLEGDEQ